jgi:DNA-binding winged helix-turn-helix (wHTH) protein/Tfp pilus assembly protein PilF
MDTAARARLKFGQFEVDLTAGELRRQGRLVRLQHQPFEVLQALIEQPGTLVSREELRRRLWPDGTSVEFDQGLNKSIAKLRDALGDAPANPRFIETLPKRGYRFIAPVEHWPSPLPDATSVVVTDGDRVSPPPMPPAGLSAVVVDTTAASARTGSWRGVIAASAIAVAGVATAWALSAGWLGFVEARPERALRSEVAEPSPIFAARDSYERGRLALARRSQQSLKLAIEHFERAIAMSPRYADAYVGLADGWSLLSSYGFVDPREGMPRVREAANRALALDPSRARAHATLGRARMVFDWDWKTAESHLRRAIELDPGDATSHQWYAYLLSGLAQHDAAIAEARRAVASDPLSLNTNTALGLVLYLSRRYDEASAQLERTLEIDPDFGQARRNLALVRIQQGRIPEAISALERVAALSESTPVAMAELAWVRALGGEQPTARRMLADIDRLRASSYVPPDSLALVYAGLEEADAAMAWLQRAATMRVSTLAHLAVDPVWDSLRDDPRLQQLVQTIRR